jgi:hypothetical protein
MPISSRSLRSRGVIGLTTLVAVAGATAAWGAIPGPDGTIQGCYHKTKGDLRVVDSPADCKPSERPLAWKQDGVGRLVVRSSDKVTVPAFGPINRQARAFCQPGEKVISGGADITGIPGGTRTGEFFSFVVRDHPLPEPPTGAQPSGWLAEATNISAKVDGGAGAEDSVLQAHVVCAS